MKRIFRLTLIATLLISISCGAFAQSKELKKEIRSLDKYYTQALADWKVPGMAIAIVKDNELIFAKGYGVKKTGTEESVSPNTVFAIASNTKSFTAASLAILVDEGKVSWDDHVREYLPWFELYDPYVSSEMTIRDLLCHRSGLKTFSGDLIWYGTNHSRKEVVKRAKHLKPAYGFRSQFGYSNILYLTAGLIIEEVSGLSWDDFIQTRIFKPLGMSNSITSTKDLQKLKDVATPHNEVDGKTIPIHYLNWDNIAPAGSIISSVNDVSKWLMLQLNHGIYEDDTIIQPDRIREMWAINTPLSVSKWSENMMPSTHYKGYGLGWSTYDLHGCKIVTHNGGYDGMISQTVLIPEKNMGFVILTNSLSSLYYPMVLRTLDVLLGHENKDWSKMFLESGNHESKKEEEVKISGTPLLKLSEYTGTYHCEMYGDAVVKLENNQLILHLTPTKIFEGPLTHDQFNTFEIEFPSVPSLPKGTVNFILDKKGKIEQMKIDVPNPDFDFTELEFYK